MKRRLSRLLFAAAATLIAAGTTLLALLALAPEAAAPAAIPLGEASFPTPTAAMSESPLPPPQGDPASDGPPLILPDMPAEEATSDSPTEAIPAAPTARVTAAPPRLIPDRITIPALEVDAPVQEVGWRRVVLGREIVGQWDTPQGYAAGWHNTSAPLGVPGNTVLNGHHNTQGKVFGGLIDLQPGDTIILWSGGQPFRYAVTQIMTLQERWRTTDERLENARWIQPSTDERVTLVTCWPRSGNSHRLIVVAAPAPAAPPGHRVR